MRPINLFLLSKTKPLNNDEFNDYVKCISKSKRNIKVRDYERLNIYQLIDKLTPLCNIEHLNGFYYSYTIDQIGKEFDLIKICKSHVLNIEIKSEFTSVEKIRKQLLLNIHYLKNIRSNVKTFTYIADKNNFYKLNNQLELVPTSIEELIEELKISTEYIDDDIDKIIEPSHYLVSPFNNVDKFMNDEYFLTVQQQQIKNAIIKDLEITQSYRFYKILGDAGTGKTLLIYDIAKELSRDKNICVVHSGILNDGHYKLNECLTNCDIVSAKSLKDLNLSKYDMIIIDETQRLYKWQFIAIVEFAVENNVKIVFSIGIDQIMQKSELDNDINVEIDKLNNVIKHTLSTKIRTNENLASFIKNVVDLNNTNYCADYENVDIYYASTKIEANELITYFKEHDYKYISFTPSKFKPHEIDSFLSSNNTHTVIGQEFDNVVMLMGQNFQYHEDRLKSNIHPNPDYIFSKLFYQGITRARLKLVIIVHRNPELYKQLVKIKENKRSE